MAFGISGAGGPLAPAMKPGVNWLGVLADALAGAAGKQGPYASMLAQQRQMQMEEQTYQHHKADALDMWRQQQEYGAAHPKPLAPTEYDRALDAAGIKPGTPEYVQHMTNFLKMKENPVWTYTDPATGAIMMGSKGPVQPQTAPPGVTFTPIDEGGPPPGAAGGFPGR